VNAPTSIEIPDSDPLRLAFFEQSDLGNAERLKALAKGRLRWIEDLQMWAWYDGRRFDLERGAIAAQRLAHDVVRHIRQESDALFEIARGCEKGEPEAHEQLTRLKGPNYGFEDAKAAAKGLIKHRIKSGSASMTAGMLRQARSDLAALSEDFDQDPLAYNVLNGTLRFRQVEAESAEHPHGRWEIKLTPHDPADLIMQLADVEYVPDADCPFWTSRLVELVPDAEQRAALQPLWGYTLTGLTSDQAFYVHQGKGNDGKSVTQQALAELHGDYYRHAGVKTFLQGAERGGAEHRSDLVRLRGDVRFVTCDEPKHRAVWDGETIKQVTGSLITARGSGDRTEVTYRPRFKLHPECNILPRAPSDDRGFRRRFKLFQWKVRLPLAGEPGHMPIDAVLAKLSAERSGILNWLIAGAIEWLETRTIPQPSEIAGVLSDFWSASSPMGDWMDEWCDTTNPEAVTYAKDLWDHFKTWKDGNGLEDEPPKTTTAFGNALRDKQFTRKKDPRGLILRKGIRLLTQAEHDARYGGPAPPGAAPVGPAPPLTAGSVDTGGPSGERPLAPPPDDDEEPLP
jgi:putative DNA primase/helicase